MLIKIYRHKQSGRLAVQNSAGNYHLAGSPENIYLKDIIESTNDWTLLIEVPISNHYSKEEVKKIFDRAERDLYLTNENVGFRISGIALNAITALKNTFFFYLNR